MCLFSFSQTRGDRPYLVEVSLLRFVLFFFVCIVSEIFLHIYTNHTDDATDDATVIIMICA